MHASIGFALLLVIAVFPSRSQDHAGSSSDLSSLTAEEARRGVYVFYTQSFIDKDNQRASYRGSLYGAIQKFELNGCELKIETVIVDKFSGTVGRAPTGPLQDTYRYSASLSLTPEIAAAAVVLEARPAQLGRNTHSVCDENASCDLPWLRIQAKSPVIHEISSVNNARDFDGQVDHFVVPISAPGIGNRLIAQMQAIADSRCR
jgi:hypothetical protein